MLSSQSITIGERNTNINTDYKVIRTLISATDSRVYLARHRVTEQLRCIKKFETVGLTPEERQHLIEDIEMSKEINHPNVARIFEYYLDSKRVYVITEFFEGGELFDYIQECSQLCESEAAYFLKQILTAVCYLHQKGIMHGDVKPENIVLDSKNPRATIKLISFGNSRRLEHKAKPEKMIGTLYYTAPEIFAHQISDKCDIWSCGVILYILLCGYPPFNANKDTEITRKIKSGAFSFPQEDWYNISDLAKNLINKMLKVDPKQRPTAADLLNDEWFQTYVQKPNFQTINSRALQQLKLFKSDYRLQSEVLLFFVNTYDIKREKQRFLQIFQEIDVDHNGYISKDELKAAFERLGELDMSEDALDAIMEKVDFDQNGGLDFTEFLVANVDYKHSLNRENMRQIFKIIDLDGNGFINQEELEEFFHSNQGEQDDLIKQIIKEVDKNGDGVISFSEFEVMMKQYLLKL